MSKCFSAFALLSLACVAVPKLPPVVAPQSETPRCGDTPAVAVPPEERDRAYTTFAAALAADPPPHGARCAVSCESAPCLLGCVYEAASMGSWHPTVPASERGGRAGFGVEGRSDGAAGRRIDLAFVPMGESPDDSICATQRVAELRATIEGAPLPAPRTRANWCPAPPDWATTADSRTTEAAALLTKLQADHGDLGACSVVCASWPCQIDCVAPISSSAMAVAIEDARLPGGTGTVATGNDQWTTRYAVRHETDPEVPFECMR